MLLDPIVLSRLQMGFTLAFHILFPSLTIGLSIYLVIWEIAWLKTRNTAYLQLCRFWSKLFALGFGLGVVSGIVLSYEFGTNFARFSELAGNVVGPLMSYEVMTAFFLEAGFLGIMLFGWRRVSPGLHLTATIIVALGASLSAFWIISANSWMHTPAGYRLDHGVFFVTNWLEVIFNPSFPYRLFHMLFASYVAVTFLVIGVSAVHIQTKKYIKTAEIAFSTAMWLALILVPTQIVLGDMHGLNTLHYQPIKVAAMEGRWETMRGAPLTLFALPSMAEEKNYADIEIPKLGSLILTHSFDGEIVGLKSVPRADRPPVATVFFAFRIMVGIGFLFMLTAIMGLWLRFKDQLYDHEIFLRWCKWISPLGFLAILAGWTTTEVGRQPWVVYGLLRTHDAASLLTVPNVLTSICAFLLLYTTLLGAFLFYFNRLIKQGPLGIKHTDTTDKLSPWLEEKL